MDSSMVECSHCEGPFVNSWPSFKKCWRTLVPSGTASVTKVLVDLGGLEGSLEGPMRLEGSLEGPILWRLHDALGFPDVLEVAVGPDDGDGLVVEVLEDPGAFSLAHLVLKG